MVGPRGRERPRDGSAGQVGGARGLVDMLPGGFLWCELMCVRHCVIIESGSGVECARACACA